ncbi:MAG: tRNA (N(6)-L-threonylcarbamoyladenosine(37)-C(2))-methylthiotransferase MtaB [Bacteroidales bacterium]|nr:tRNA (N(6)-L-threonylcarbamoyladenosine(37)-C(2))-methylthiotransferase MtaB [Bacteroidales bacterium]
MRVAFHTLGCKLNFAETSTLAGKFLDQGYERVDFNEKADIYVINTCSVTGKADRKSKEAIKKARNQNPEAKIVAVGCYAQLQSEKIANIKGVDLILGCNEKFRILEYLKNHESQEEPEIHTCALEDTVKYNPSFSKGDRTRSFLKIQDGCDYVCSYCTVPMARGKSRNQSIESILEEARVIANSGVKEVVLTGVNIGDFGKSTGESFYGLINQLEKVQGIERFRISSIEPNLLNNKIIRFVSQSEKFLPHFHIPLQSGCNDILAKMKRRYKRELLKDRIEQIKKHIPGAFIGVDVIVGFPGEDRDKFRETYKFLEDLDAGYYHVFSYSQRPGTSAAGMSGKVSGKEIKQRSREVQQLAEDKKQKFYRQHLGKMRKVLFENRNDNGSIMGFTDNYIKVEVDCNDELHGKIRDTALKEINSQGNVTGEVRSD